MHRYKLISLLTLLAWASVAQAERPTESAASENVVGPSTTRHFTSLQIIKQSHADTVEIQPGQKPTVDNWLDKMSQASRLQNYRGTLIIRQKDKLQAIRVNQGINNEGSWQTLESLTGEQQKILRQNDRVTSIFPAKKLVTISGESERAPLHPILPENRRILKKYYQLSLAGQDRIANKQAQIIKMTPRDKHRYGYVFWLDQESGILLKCDMLDEKGRVLEQLMYSDVELLNAEPERSVDVAALNDYKTLNFRKADTRVSAIWKARQLPEGFVLKRSVKTAGQNHITHHLVFSDGMASVSVFVEQKKINKPVLGVSRMGPVNAFSSVINGRHITAIGEVPVSTVQMIAQSIEAVN